MTYWMEFMPAGSPRRFRAGGDKRITAPKRTSMLLFMAASLHAGRDFPDAMAARDSPEGRTYTPNPNLMDTLKCVLNRVNKKLRKSASGTGPMLRLVL